MKKTMILKPDGVDTLGTLHKTMDEIKAALKAGNNVIIEIDIGEVCPKCGGASMDAGDMWLKQYGKRHRTCINCMYIWPEGG